MKLVGTFEYLFVDEAGQVTLELLAVLGRKAQNLVLVLWQSLLGRSDHVGLSTMMFYVDKFHFSWVVNGRSFLIRWMFLCWRPAVSLWPPDQGWRPAAIASTRPAEALDDQSWWHELLGVLYPRCCLHRQPLRHLLTHHLSHECSTYGGMASQMSLLIYLVLRKQRC